MYNKFLILPETIIKFKQWTQEKSMSLSSLIRFSMTKTIKGTITSIQRQETQFGSYQPSCMNEFRHIWLHWLQKHNQSWICTSTFQKNSLRRNKWSINNSQTQSKDLQENKWRPVWLIDTLTKKVMNNTISGTLSTFVQKTKKTKRQHFQDVTPN